MKSRPARLAMVVAVALWGAACTSNRDVLTAPEPQSLAAYLGASHPSDIQVTGKDGVTRWIHNPVVDGDSLRGVRGHDLPQLPVSIAVSQIAGIQEPHFSTGKTLGLLGGVVATAGVALLILGSMIGTHVAY